MHLKTKELIDKLIVMGDAKFTGPFAKAVWTVARNIIVVNEAKIIEEVDTLSHNLVDTIVAKGDAFVASTPSKVDDIIWTVVIKPFLVQVALELQLEG